LKAAAKLLKTGLEPSRGDRHARRVDSEQTTDPRRAVGAIGEAAVRDFVATRGWRIVDHNVRWREGELDLIAIDGQTLVIGEVKTLVTRANGRRSAFSPFESIDRKKQGQIRSLARRWLVDELRRCDTRDVRFNSIRFDAFAVLISRAGEVTNIEHLEDAF
jgi:putative endonuclease